MRVIVAPIPILLLDNCQVIVAAVAMIQLSLADGFVFLRNQIVFTQKKL